ncbi:MAG: nucleotidyltransferase domain-containing protein [Lachnospiraceae bacterium]|nr:nucleotidyltransferase domain-containing protein [Lachnospiraceae bacterium]
MDFIKLMNSAEYDFLRSHPRLGGRIILLGLGGSHAYGTANEHSDVDFRGITMNLPSDLLGLTEFEQYTDTATDTVIYSFNKIVKLLLECNPNTIEMLGLDEQQYLIKTPLGQELLDNKSLFLSKRALRSFGGYADAQLRRLQNAIARDTLPQQEREEHIRRSIRNALEDFMQKNELSDRADVRIYTDRSQHPDFETEMFIDAEYRHLPLRDYVNMAGTMNSVIRDYDKLGKRNRKKDDNHLNKHAMHLIRLFLMALDILERGEIRTHRTDDMELLRSIRRGDFQKKDGTFSEEFYRLLSDYERRLELAAVHTALPDQPDMERIGRFVEAMNRKALDLQVR